VVGPRDLSGGDPVWAISSPSFTARFLYETGGQTASLNQLIQAGRAAGERVFEIIDEPAESQRGRKFEREVRVRLNFEMSVFTTASELPALSNVSFHARPGENHRAGWQKPVRENLL
jgi:ABC-type multidrug transport system fused ATPase/permease subunit